MLAVEAAYAAEAPEAPKDEEGWMDAALQCGMSVTSEGPSYGLPDFGLYARASTFGVTGGHAGLAFDATGMIDLVEGYDFGFGLGGGLAGRHGAATVTAGIGADRLGYRDMGARKAFYGYARVQAAVVGGDVDSRGGDRAGVGVAASYHLRSSDMANQEVRLGGWFGFLNLRWGVDVAVFHEDPLRRWPAQSTTWFFWMGAGLPSASWGGG